MKNINKKIRVAILAPVFLAIPPKKQGGTEWVVYHQANGLTDLGFNVSLFAVKGSKTKGKLIPVAKKGVKDYDIELSTMEGSRKQRLENILITNLLTELIKRKNEFDVIFNHVRGGEMILPFSKFIKAPIIHVQHLPIFKELSELYQKYNAPLISVSNNQRSGFKKLNFIKTVYNAVDTEIFKFNPKPSNYVFYISTIGEHKNTLDAVLAAKKANIKLILAGKIRDKKYFEEKIKPYIDNKKIIYKGEIGLKEKIKLYKGAKALLFPTKIKEAFGLVAIEALSCGTPVIAYKNGALKEIVKNKYNGFIASSPSSMGKAITQVDAINRANCRKSAESNFTVEKMANGYAESCYKILN